MRHVTIHNLSTPDVEPLSAKICASFLCQLRGLTFRRMLPREEGLLLVQRSDSRLEAAIHMIGVFTDLAVVWINSSKKVVDVRLARRWRPLYVPRRPARYVLEIAPERMQDFTIGDEVDFEETP